MTGKLGIIAGSGDLPSHVIQACLQQKRPVFVIAIEGETTSPLLEKVPHHWLPLGKVGHAIGLLREAKVTELIMVGKVNRPTLSHLKLDRKGLQLLSLIAKERAFSDNAIFSKIAHFFEQQKFKIVGIKEVADTLLAPLGVMGKYQPSPKDHQDIAWGIKVASLIGELDIGQAVVVQHHVVLGIEALEGTDALLERCGRLKQPQRSGVLVKIKKPTQESRVDLPTIGVQTIEKVYQAGFSGIAVEAEQTIILHLPEVIAKADQLGIFLIGIHTNPSESQL